MKLIDYLNALPKDERDSFAKSCKTTFGYLRQVGYGNRLCTEGLAMLLESASDRVLTCESLCPDADWGFVRTGSASTKFSTHAPPPPAA
jgi:DNA-binding transcriptional regulator YdaS (Cro superfamily)